MLSWFFSTGTQVTYERRILDPVSLIGTVQYSPNIAWGLHEYDQASYFNVTAGGRYYWGSLLKDAARDVNIGTYSKYIPKLFTDALGGFYVGVSGMYSHVIADDRSDSNYIATANAYGGGSRSGMQVHLQR